MAKATLGEYRRKRDFKKTKEPSGRVAKAQSQRFVIQKHDASHLHFDLRLEIDGVYKSWAVPKGPSLNPQNKRLAVEVEDHPLDYGTFEGTIPQGQYGGGTVMLWDRGTFLCEGDPSKDLKAGSLKITFQGERMQGKWALVRMHRKEGDAHTNWLLIKEHDGQESSRRKDLVETFVSSVKTSRSMSEIAGGVTAPEKPDHKDSVEEKATISARKTALPGSLKPQLATLSDHVPEGDEWVHEVKFDGYRILTFIEGGKVRLATRNGLDWTPQFHQLVKPLSKLPVQNAILDGEVVVLDKKGISNFGALQEFVKEQSGTLTYFLFDLPYLEGYDLTKNSLLERKALLKELLSGQRTLRYSEHVSGDGQEFFKKATLQGLEGIVSKRVESTYHESRTRDWLKIKGIQRQEFVVGGYTDPGGSRSSLGSLLLGFYENDKFVYCGRVGSGFNDSSLKSALAQLKQFDASSSSFDEGPTREEARGVHYVKPELVCEVEFTAWTDDRRLRHPVFLGFREDKKPKSIGEEKAIHTEESAMEDKFAGISITHPERVIYPDVGITKVELVKYLFEVSEWLLPHVADRALAIVRCPQGEEKECFFQKNFSDSLPDALHSVDLGDAHGIGLSDVKGLVALGQYGVIEIHPWGSKENDIEHPDRLTFDLDPGEGLGWEHVVEAALDTRKVLDQIGLQSWVKTSGGKGLHVCVPIQPELEWTQVKEFCHGIALLMEERSPDKYLSTMSKAKRKGRIFVDYLRNGRGATSVAAFSPRARAGAPVSVPVDWKELKGFSGAAHFDLSKTLARLKRMKRDPWADFFTDAQDLTKVFR